MRENDRTKVLAWVEAVNGNLKSPAAEKTRLPRSELSAAQSAAAGRTQDPIPRFTESRLKCPLRQILVQSPHRPVGSRLECPLPNVNEAIYAPAPNRVVSQQIKICGLWEVPSWSTLCGMSFVNVSEPNQLDRLHRKHKSALPRTTAPSPYFQSRPSAHGSARPGKGVSRTEWHHVVAWGKQ